jgi:formate dehydrogenase subunit gamma
MPRFEPWSVERGRAVIAAEAERPGALLPIFHALQDTFGCVADEAIRLVAEVMNLSRAEVYGVASFYHDFRRTPPGRRVLKLCRAESCQARGGDVLAERAQHQLGIRFGETTADGRVTLDAVYCLGLCALSPAAMLDGEVVARLDEPAVDALVREAQA